MDLFLRRLLRSRLAARAWPCNWTWFVIAGCVYVLRRALSDKGGLVSSVQDRTRASRC